MAKAAPDGSKACVLCRVVKGPEHFIRIKSRLQRTVDCRSCRNAKRKQERRARGLKFDPEQRAIRSRVRLEVSALRVLAKALKYRRVAVARPLWGHPRERTTKAMLIRARYLYDLEYRAYVILKRHKRDEATRLACDGTITPNVLYHLFSRTKVCGFCGCDMAYQDKSLDHLVPISRGGVHGVENVEVVCLPCNKAKHTATALEYIMARAA